MAQKPVPKPEPITTLWERELLGEIWVDIPPGLPYPERLKMSYPYGPAPEGWEPVEFCSKNLPHDENDWWQNIELNADHYPDYVRDLIVDTYVTTKKNVRDDIREYGISG